ncbi:hypothetical protein Pmani_027550 [Petrolisthes manimaculis]|uniref:Uncharacterized protein n=1 Tax=Petrolisthes manimaculis TaxID=1843537 RepID=A0AAE1P3B1_9EUCA|nr:hypothetical protein Pmani_027550 [Petrolisthes manimaculis]
MRPLHRVRVTLRGAQLTSGGHYLRHRLVLGSDKVGKGRDTSLRVMVVVELAEWGEGGRLAVGRRKSWGRGG